MNAINSNEVVLFAFGSDAKARIDALTMEASGGSSSLVKPDLNAIVDEPLVN